MTSEKDLVEVIRRRLESLKKPELDDEKPSSSSQSPLIPDEGVGLGLDSKRAKKGKYKRLKGYMNKTGKQKGKK